MQHFKKLSNLSAVVQVTRTFNFNGFWLRLLFLLRLLRLLRLRVLSGGREVLEDQINEEAVHKDRLSTIRILLTAPVMLQIA
jgi:predicted ABC-type ATPase